MIRIITAFIFLVFAQVTFGQSLDKVKLDAYFDALRRNGKFMGTVAVSKDGKLIYTNAVGYADVAAGIKANDSTKYRIGSISKTFTAVLVMKAVEQKKIKPDQTIDQYFPEIKNAQKITVDQLLHHRSGIHNFTDDSSYLGWHTRPKTEKELVSIIAKGGVDFEAGTTGKYSNSNYVLLSFILEKIFKKSYRDLLKEYITKPLGLSNTFYGGKIDVAKNQSKSYSFGSSWKEESETDLSIPLGAGGIVSTSIDLVKFSDALFNGKLLQKESVDKMKTTIGDFGMGLFRIPFYDMEGFGHTGGIDGFTSVFSHFDSGNVSYALTSNGTNYNNNDISIAVLSAVYDKPYDIPVFSTYAPTANELDELVGVYASEQTPLKVTIRHENNAFTAQATGQQAFPLEAVEKNLFQFKPAKLVMTFNPAEKTMVLKQGGREVLFKKES